jgi:hypothetical protein
MYDGLTVLVLGACNLNDTVYSLEKNTDHWPRMAANSNGNARRLDPNTPVVHSLEDTLQLVRLCTGELDMPSWIANYID